MVHHPLIRGILAAGLMVGLLGGSDPVAQAQSTPAKRALTINADSQEANANTGVITAIGNVRISFPAEQVAAQAQKATYFTKEQRIVLEGGVNITQRQNRLQADKVTYLVREGKIQAAPTTGQQVESVYVIPDASPTTP